MQNNVIIRKSNIWLYAMNPIDWLCAKAPGFDDLSENERAAIMHFSLLWSFFEAEALHTNASAKSILALVHGWASNGRLNIAPFATSLAYFRDRYFNQGTFTEHFRGLNLRRNDSPDLVRAVTQGREHKRFRHRLCSSHCCFPATQQPISRGQVGLRYSRPA